MKLITGETKHRAARRQGGLWSCCCHWLRRAMAEMDSEYG